MIFQRLNQSNNSKSPNITFLDIISMNLHHKTKEEHSFGLIKPAKQHSDFEMQSITDLDQKARKQMNGNTLQTLKQRTENHEKKK